MQEDRVSVYLTHAGKPILFGSLWVQKIHKVSAAQHENLESNAEYVQPLENAPEWAILISLKITDDWSK